MDESFGDSGCLIPRPERTRGRPFIVSNRTLNQPTMSRRAHLLNSSGNNRSPHSAILMSNSRGPKGLRAFAAAILVASTLPALAATPPPPDPEQLKLDGAIQGLKDEVLNLNREALWVENEVLYPQHTRANIYFGVRVGGLLIKTLSISIDDGEAQTHSYTDAEARALLTSESLHRVLRTSLEPGPHRVSVQYTAQFADADEGDAPITGQYDAIFDKRSRTAELELTLSRGTRLSQPQMRLRDRKVAAADEQLPPKQRKQRPRRPRSFLQ